jgi:mediator of RNA polymerase II transcription subunit 16, fungi type
MLKITVDYSEDSHHDGLVRNNLLQLCMSLQNQLGFKGEFQPRSFSSKFAMLGLNARNVVILITIASNTPLNIREKLSPLDEPGESYPLPCLRVVFSSQQRGPISH